MLLLLYIRSVGQHRPHAERQREERLSHGGKQRLECDFAEALEKLAIVQASMITYSMEDKYRKSDIKDMESSLKFLKEAENNEE